MLWKRPHSVYCRAENARERTRTSTGYKSHQHLKLARLPIPPLAPSREGGQDTPAGRVLEALEARRIRRSGGTVSTMKGHDWIIASHQRDLPFDPGRILSSRGALCFRTTSWMPPQVPVLRYRVCLQRRRPEGHHLDRRGGPGPWMRPCSDHRRRAASAGTGTRVDGGTVQPGHDRAPRDFGRV